eukprot:TRINITY_DN47454_c0_g1_i1.p1 TRINITY_DN47454_c0_g1~~TRINITY_DN47454_c0_g1_i1.p1  ORF type:complete len:249 (+),score=75.86 TRINITY_DN47454_c0_g1_i1:88-747(+)
MSSAAEAGGDGKIHCLDRLTTDVLDKFASLFAMFLKVLVKVAALVCIMGQLAHMWNVVAPPIKDWDESPAEVASPALSPREANGIAQLKWDYQVWSVISDIGYVALTLVIIVADLEVDKFLDMAPMFGHWFPRACLQLFVGVQTINAASTLHVTGADLEGVVPLGEAGGWLLGAHALFSFFLNTLFRFTARPIRLCGFCCVVSFAVMIPIFAAIGTTAD